MGPQCSIGGVSTIVGILVLPIAVSINVTGSWNWVRHQGYRVTDDWCNAKGRDPWPPYPQTWLITMNLTQHGDNSVTGAVVNSGGGNLTGYVISTETVPLMVLERRHFNGSYLKSRGVNAYFLGHLVGPGIFNMSFINDNGQSCSTVTLTLNTTTAREDDNIISAADIHPTFDSNSPLPPTALPPTLNCSWTTKWFKGSQAPIAALNLHETPNGNLQGSCTAPPGAQMQDKEGGGGVGAGECTVVRTDQLYTPRRHTIVQVNFRVSGRLVVLAATLCPSGVCGMVQWISGDGDSGQLSLVPSGDASASCSSPPHPPVPPPTPPHPHPSPRKCLHNSSWYAWDLDWNFDYTIK